MHRRGLGFILVLTFVIVVAAVIQDFRLDLSGARERAAADTILRASDSLDLTLANLRAAQAGYLAAGQSSDFWTKRAADLSSQLEGTLTSLQGTATSPEARSHYDAAGTALGNLSSLDQKARDDVASGDRFLASDVVFMDAMDAGRRLSAEVAAARDAELAARETRLAELRRWRLGLNAGAIALVFALLAPFVRRRPAPAEAVAEAPAEPVAVQPASIAPAPLPEPAPTPNLSLAEAADVCVDLARMLDSRDAPPLFERAARALSAKGLVLWMADGRGVLRPSLAHGYPEKILQRLGTLDADADNVTSLAFRSMRAQAVGNPSHGSSGAIAVPLITPTGCVGVLAAEVTSSAGSEDTLALARMFAAQLATVVTPADEPAVPKAAEI